MILKFIVSSKVQGMKEKEDLKDALSNLNRVIDDNPCGMGRSMFNVLALLAKESVKYFKRKRYLSTDEAARMIGVSPRTLRRRIKDGLLPPPRHYGHWEVSHRLEDIENYIAQNNKVIG